MLSGRDGDWTIAMNEKTAEFRILALVGTDHHPFDRMVELVDALQQAGEPGRNGRKCLIQFGTSSPPRYAQGMDYLPKSDVQRQIDLADLVICHGGPSTIMEILRSGKRPLVIARDPRKGEHVDGHQQRFARHMANQGHIDLADSAYDVEQLLSHAASTTISASNANVSLPSPDASALLLGALVDGLIAEGKSYRIWHSRRNESRA